MSLSRCNESIRMITPVNERLDKNEYRWLHCVNSFRNRDRWTLSPLNDDALLRAQSQLCEVLLGWLY